MRRLKGLSMDKALQLLGLMYKAKRMILSEGEVLDHLSDIRFMVIASDISQKSKERFLKKCSYYKIEYCDKYSTIELSNAIGKDNVKVMGLTDKGFVKAFVEKL